MWAQDFKGIKPFDQILEKKSLSLIDPRKELIEKREVGETYSKFDTHWTDYGGYIAWQKVAFVLEERMPSFQAFGFNTIEEIKIYPEKKGDLLKILRIKDKNEWAEAVLSEDFHEVSEKREGSRFFKKREGSFQIEKKDFIHNIEIYNPSSQNNLKAIVFTDSMGEALSPFINSSFESIKYFERDSISSGFKEIVEEFKPEVIFYIITERELLYPPLIL